MDTGSGTEGGATVDGLWKWDRRGATVDGHWKWDRRGCYCKWTLEVGQKGVLL